MNDTLKVAGRIGAELGAAKAENEKLRGLLRELREITIEYAWDADLEARVDAALSQQPEPTDTYTAVEMATAAAQGFRDGQAAVEPAPAQDERKTFEVEIPDISAIYDGRSFIPYRSLEAGERLMTVAQHLRIEKQLRAALTRPAQTEQQPKEEIPKPDGWVAAGRFFTDRDEAIAAAEKTPCVDVYFRPSLLTVLARSAERQQAVHWRAVLDPAEVPMQLNPHEHIAGFTDRRKAEDWIAARLCMDGWHYTLEPLYASPPPAQDVSGLVEALEAIVRQYPNPDITHVDYRVQACKQAEHALEAYRATLAAQGAAGA